MSDAVELISSSSTKLTLVYEFFLCY